MVFGVSSGLGDYFDVDPTLVRLAFVLVTLVGGAGYGHVARPGERRQRDADIAVRPSRREYLRHARCIGRNPELCIGPER